jgi:hypothetical protein
MSQKNPLFTVLWALTLCFMVACASDPDKKAKDGAAQVDAPIVKTLFVTKPGGATVSLNGIAVGNTPCAFVIPGKKEIEIKIEKQGYWSIVESFPQPIDGWPTSLSYRLQKKVR